MIRLTNLLRESQDAVTISATDTGDLKIWNRDSDMVYIWRLRIDPDVPLVADFNVTINDANTAKKQLTISYDPPVGAAVSNKTITVSDTNWSKVLTAYKNTDDIVFDKKNEDQNYVTYLQHIKTRKAMD